MAGIPASIEDKAATIAMGNRAGVALAAALRMSAVEVYERIFADVPQRPPFVNIGTFGTHRPGLDPTGSPRVWVCPDGLGAAMFYLPGATPEAALASDLDALAAMNYTTVPVLGDVSQDGARGREWWPAWGQFAYAATKRGASDRVIWFNRPPFGPGPDADAEAFMGDTLRAIDVALSRFQD